MSLCKTLSFLVLFFSAQVCLAQGKYFEVVCKKNNPGSKELYGTIEPLNGKVYIDLSYKGKTKAQLMAAFLDYLKHRPGLKVSEIDSSESAFLWYGDFANIGDTARCKANMVSHTVISAIPDDGVISLHMTYGIQTHIYSSLYGTSRFSISPDNIVVTEDDVPFNEYQMIQPADEKYTRTSGLFSTTQKVPVGSVYPESVFDADGKVVNPVNKKLIEDFYDAYIIDLKAYLDKHLK